MDPNSNASTLAAAGPDQESEAWAASSTIDRSCGSVWSSALVSVSLEEGSKREPLLEPPAHPRDEVGLLPELNERQGLYGTKPADYLAATFASTDLDVEVSPKLRLLVGKLVSLGTVIQ